MYHYYYYLFIYLLLLLFCGYVLVLLSFVIMRLIIINCYCWLISGQYCYYNQYTNTLLI